MIETWDGQGRRKVIDDDDAQGLIADRPGASAVTAGRFYFATDTGQLFRDNGTSWTDIGKLASPTAGDVRANDTLELGASFQTAPGTQVGLTVPVASKLLVIATFDFESNSDGPLTRVDQGTIFLDNVEQNRSAYRSGSTSRVTVQQSYLLTLAAGSHIINQRARELNGGGFQADLLHASNTGFTYMLLPG